MARAALRQKNVSSEFSKSYFKTKIGTFLYFFIFFQSKEVMMAKLKIEKIAERIKGGARQVSHAASKTVSLKSTDPRLKTGIPGLDEILKGGIREKSAVLVSGGPGTGKTILAMQFLAEGAKNGEAGMYILYDTEKEELLDYAQDLGIDLRKYENKSIFVVKQPLLVQKTPSLAIPLQLLRDKKIKRVVLDSLTMFSYVHVTEDRSYRAEIVTFLDRMKNVTLIATSEASGSYFEAVSYKPEDFLFDGIIFMAKIRQEASFERVLHVAKMRGQEHLMNIYPVSVSEGGIKVYPDQLPFSLMGKETRFSARE